MRALSIFVSACVGGVLGVGSGEGEMGFYQVSCCLFKFETNNMIFFFFNNNYE